MLHTLKVSDDGSLFTVTTSGNGDLQGIIAFLEDIISHPQWKPGNFVLLDHRSLSIHEIDASGVQGVSEFFISIGAKLGKGKIALVMNRDVDFGIARHWEIITGDLVDIQINVFRDIDKATAWLKE